MKKLFPYTKGYRLLIVLGVLCSVGEAVMELKLPQLMSDIVDVGIASGDRRYIMLCGLKMVGMALLALLFGVSAACLAARASMGFGAELRLAEYEKIQKFSFRNIEHFSTSSLITRLTNDVTSVQTTLQMGMRIMVRAPSMLVTALIMALGISGRLSRVFLVVIPILCIAVLLVVKKVGPTFTGLQKATDDVNLVVQEDLSAIRVVKSYVREEKEKEKFSQKNSNLRSTAEKAFGFVVIFLPAIILVMGGTITAVMWIGGKMVGAGTLLSGDLLAYFTYVSEILVSLMMLSMVLMILTRAIACGKRIIEVLDEVPEITDDAAAADAAAADGSVRFDHVFFRYNDTAEAWNLEDVTLEIPSGATVGILGGTGSAKTTLVSLIPRLYEVDEGAVYVGGRDVREYPMDTLREAVAMVLQKNTLFSGTIADNLRWGDENATDAQIEEACRIACADEFIRQRPEGYETYIEQGGTNVSGGQKQRLCIARAILRHPKVLIFDDSTSAVDTATDAKIRAGLRTALPGTTKIIIAQRVNSVMDADMIVVMDDGRISAVGSHEALLKTSHIYREVYESQQEGVQDNG